MRTAVVRAGSSLVENAPKTASGDGRGVSLSSDTVDLLMGHFASQVADRPEAGPAYVEGPHGGRVFARPDGSGLDPNGVSLAFVALVKAAGLRPQRLHDLRHLSASFDALAGVPMNVTSKRLGHSHPSFTAKVHSHIYDSAAWDAAEAVSGLFRRASEPVS